MALQQSDMFLDGLRGELRRDETMARHTSWRVGGPADYFYTPADKADLAQLLRQLPSAMPFYWVGLGSNLLVRDGGLRGMVIRSHKGLIRIERVEEQGLYAETGVTSAKVARAAMQAGLAGAEFLAGIPGSFGGALAMNAGAFGGETWDLVRRAECVTRTGELVWFDADAIETGYRTVRLPPDHWFVAAELELEKAQESGGRARIRSLLERRGASQPVQSANAGSVFRNPPGDHAARLLEAVGMKGAVIGDAEVSTLHANFIINRGAATAADIEALIEEGRAVVADRFGVMLEPEVRIVGEPS
ncbi:MAG: UDP-N-acetylmuramate dehydrogenase [Pseudomonadota bacterium]|nr:UDP-N-acetylmuramate dehydrogenase [Pseudomonadota bacterium]